MLWEVEFLDYAGILPSREALERAARAVPGAPLEVIVREALAVDGLLWVAGEAAERPRKRSEAPTLPATIT